MKRIFILLLLLQLIAIDAYSEVKTTESGGIVFNIDTEKGTASVGQNYKKSIVSGDINYTGTLSGDVLIPSSVKYRGKQYPVQSIDKDAFYGCRYIISITIPETISDIDYRVFNYMLSDLKAINVAPGNEHYTSVDGILFTRGMSKIVKYPGQHDGTSYIIPSSVLSIENSSFSHCSYLSEIVLPDNLEYIGDNAFENCSFKEIVLPGNLKQIGNGAFYSCFSLVTITIPESVTAMGTDVFRFCYGLESIICRNIDLKITPDMTSNCDKLNGRIIYEIPSDKLIQLAESGNTEYQYMLGMNYLEGKGVEKNQSLAIEWLEKSAGAGYQMSQMALGEFYLGNNGLKKDFATAIKWYSKAAENGNEKAQSFLGDCYLDAVGVGRDLKKATGYYLLAAEQGDTNAVKKLGYCYYNGKGVNRDYAEAGRWYLKSARNGDAESAYYVALMFHEGKGLASDDSQSIIWAEKAAAKGSEEGRWLYCELAYDDALKNIDSSSYNTAISRLTSLLEYDKDNVDAYINRGFCYMNAEPADYTLAESDFKKALELDGSNTVAQDNLKIASQEKQRLDEAKSLCTEGNVYFWKEDYVNAVSCYTRSIAIDDANPYPYYAIGYCFFSCEQYGDAIGFFDKALLVDPGYEDAKKAKNTALDKIYNQTIQNVVNSFSNSLNDAYNNNLNNSNTSDNNSLNNSAGRAVERNKEYANSQYEMYMRFYDQEQAETDSYLRKYELYGNIDDLEKSKRCQSRANDYLEKANIWK